MPLQDIDETTSPDAAPAGSTGTARTATPTAIGIADAPRPTQKVNASLGMSACGHTRARPPTPELASYCFARSPASSFFRGVFENVVCQHSTLSPLSISSWKVSGNDSGSTGVASIAPPALT